PEPVDNLGTLRRDKLRTGQGTWSARCGESRTPGVAGGPWETDGGNAETAPTVLPDLRAPAIPASPATVTAAVRLIHLSVSRHADLGASWAAAPVIVRP